MHQLENEALRFREWAHSDERVTGVHFFGSQVKGNHRPDSDLDVAIQLSGEDSGFVEWMFSAEDLRTSTAQLTDLRVDLQLMHPTDSVVTPSVRDEGLLVFDRSKSEQ